METRGSFVQKAVLTKVGSANVILCKALRRPYRSADSVKLKCLSWRKANKDR